MIAFCQCEGKIFHTSVTTTRWQQRWICFTVSNLQKEYLCELFLYWKLCGQYFNFGLGVTSAPSLWTNKLPSRNKINQLRPNVRFSECPRIQDPASLCLVVSGFEMIELKKNNLFWGIYYTDSAETKEKIDWLESVNKSQMDMNNITQYTSR